jgi:hypothetical protein
MWSRDRAAFPCGLTTEIPYGVLEYSTRDQNSDALHAVKPVIQPFFSRPRWTRTYAAFLYRLTGRSLVKTSLSRGNSFLCRLFFGCPEHPAATVVCALGEANKPRAERRASRSVRMSMASGFWPAWITGKVYHGLQILYSGVEFISFRRKLGENAARFQPNRLDHSRAAICFERCA